MNSTDLEDEVCVLTSGFAQAYGADAPAMVELLAAVGDTSDERSVLRQVAAQLRMGQRST